MPPPTPKSPARTPAATPSRIATRIVDDAHPARSQTPRAVRSTAKPYVSVLARMRCCQAEPASAPGGGRQADERRVPDLDLSAQPVGDHAGRRRDRDGHERRRGGRALGDARDEDEQRDGDDTAADSEEGGEDPRREPDGDEAHAAYRTSMASRVGLAAILLVISGIAVGELGGAPAADGDRDLRRAARSATLPVARAAAATGSRSRTAPDALRGRTAAVRCYVARAVDTRVGCSVTSRGCARSRRNRRLSRRDGRPRRARGRRRVRTRRNSERERRVLPRRRHGYPLRSCSVLLLPRDAGQRLDAHGGVGPRSRRIRAPRRPRSSERRLRSAVRTASMLAAVSRLRPTAGGSSARSGSTSERRCLAPEHVPRESHVVLRRAEVADGEAQHVAPAEPRVREEDLAGGVHALEQALVVLVGALPTEADEREVPRRGRPPSPARRAPSPRRARRAGGARGAAPAGPTRP